MPEIVMHSFKDFLTIKTLANKHKFHHQMKIHNIQDNQNIFENEVLIILESNSILQMKTAIYQLKKQGITVKQSTRLFQSQKLETFNSFTQKVFKSKYSYSILIVDSFFSKRLVKLIPNYLFSQEEKFSIQKLNKYIQDKSYISWFLIKEDIVKAIDNSTPKKYFSCNNLIKLELSFIINLSQFIKFYQRREHFIPTVQLNSKLQGTTLQKYLEKHKPQETYIYIGKNLTFYIKISANQIQDSFNKLKQFYQIGFRSCIEWNNKELIVNQMILLNCQDLEILKKGLIQRNKKYITEFNLTSKSNLQKSIKYQHEKNPTQQNIGSENYIKKKYIPEMKHFLSGKDRDILNFEDKWPEISQFLYQRIRSRSMIQMNTYQQLKTIVKILDYRLNKFRVQKSKSNFQLNKDDCYKEDPFQSQLIKSESIALNNYFFLYEYFFPDYTKIVQNLCIMFNMKSIRQITREKFRIFLKDNYKQDNLSRKVVQPGKFSTNLSSIQKLEKNIKEYVKIMAQVTDDLKNKQLKDCNYQQNVLDKLLLDYFSEIESINQGKGYFYVKIEGFQKKQLKQFIGEIISFQQNFFYWQDVFNMTTLNARICHLDRQKVEKNIELTLYTNPSCLGCAQFFVLNKSVINRHNRTPLRVFSQGSVSSRIKNEFMEQVCNMLNKNGGIILFNCIKNYGSILPKGSYLTKIDRKNYIEQIKQILIQFYPVVRLDQQIFISFVPIVIQDDKKDQTALKMCQQPLKKYQLYQPYSKIDGFFIMRVKVCSKDQSVTYNWEQKAKQVQKSRIRKNSQLQTKNQYYQQNDFMPQTFRNPLNHQCKEIIITQAQDQSNIRQKPYIALQKNYQHMSMIVAKSQNLQKIKDILEAQHFNIQIRSVFKGYQFGIAKYTAVLFHNESFSQILRFFINSKDLIFDSKRVLSLFITEYLKMDSEEGLKKEDLQNACIWLKKEFPQEKLRYFISKGNNASNLINYYVKTESKMSTLFMYYVFNHYKFKTVFKNPPSSQLRSLQQHKIQFKDKAPEAKQRGKK